MFKIQVINAVQKYLAKRGKFYHFVEYSIISRSFALKYVNPNFNPIKNIAVHVYGCVGTLILVGNPYSLYIIVKNITPPIRASVAKKSSITVCRAISFSNAD